WQYSFKNLDKYDAQGKLITYTTKEATVPDYSSTQKGDNFTNTLKSGTTTVNGTKTWVDDNNANNTRPKSITVDLYKNGNKVSSKQVTAADDWQYSFKNLDKYDAQGKLITYTTKEATVPDYSSTQKGDNFTNTLKSGTTSVNGTKTWVDDNNATNTRPRSITVDLYKNGNKVSSKQVTAADDWQYSFTGLDKYDNQGKLITYTTKEEAVKDYTSEQNGFNFTNTLTVTGKPHVPGKPNQPNKPNKPNKPTQPAKPNQPNQPTQPAKPNKPNKPTPAVKPNTPGQPTQPAKVNQPSQPAQTKKTKQSVKRQTTAKRKGLLRLLPQTGEVASTIFIGLGILILGGVAWFVRRRHSRV
uniref:Cna B-type domain-containing protein n=1 Tax=Loigolactobacillus iwatensis TaxID=1267156 RepID=UPI000F7D731B